MPTFKTRVTRQRVNRFGTLELYRHFDKNRQLLYVGISLNASERLWSHRRNTVWANKVHFTTVEYFHDSADARSAERKAIISEAPLHNKTYNERITDNDEIAYRILSDRNHKAAVRRAYKREAEEVFSACFYNGIDPEDLSSDPRGWWWHFGEIEEIEEWKPYVPNPNDRRYKPHLRRPTAIEVSERTLRCP